MRQHLWMKCRIRVHTKGCITVPQVREYDVDALTQTIPPGIVIRPF